MSSEKHLLPHWIHFHIYLYAIKCCIDQKMISIFYSAGHARIHYFRGQN